MHRHSDLKAKSFHSCMAQAYFASYNKSENDCHLLIPIYLGRSRGSLLFVLDNLFPVLVSERLMSAALRQVIPRCCCEKRYWIRELELMRGVQALRCASIFADLRLFRCHHLQEGDVSVLTIRLNRYAGLKCGAFPTDSANVITFLLPSFSSSSCR